MKRTYLAVRISVTQYRHIGIDINNIIMYLLSGRYIITGCYIILLLNCFDVINTFNKSITNHNFQVNTNYTLVHQVSYNFLYVFGALF